MKRIFIACVVAFGAMSLYAKDIKEMVVTTSPQMTCQNCENKIKGNLRFEKGVKNVETDLAAQTVTVTYDADKTDEAKITKAFEKLNYKVSPASEKNCSQSEAKACDGKCKGEAKEAKACCGEKAEKKCCDKAIEKKCDGACKAEKKECKAACKAEEKKCDGACKAEKKECDGACKKDAKAGEKSCCKEKK